jgi:membrane protein DedA with SNARE-associated domain
VLASLLGWIAAHGLPALFVLLMVGVFGLPVPDEALLTFAGVLAGQGRLPFAATWAVAATGAMCGITVSFLVGRTGGRVVVARYGAWLHITPERVVQIERWMEHSGRWVLAFGYFVPGVRHVTAIVAGFSGVPPRIFASAAYLGAALWSLTFITLGWYVGERWEEVLHIVNRHLVTGAAVIIAVAALAGVTQYVRSRLR